MAKLISLFNFVGSLGEATGTRRLGRWIIKMKSTLTKDRILNDPVFQRTRENMAEFSEAAHGMGYTRQAVTGIKGLIPDALSVSRLLGVYRNMLSYDTTSLRGERKVSVALGDAGAKALLKTYNFNNGAPLNQVLNHPYTVDMVTYTVDIDNLVPINGLRFPPAATHFSAQALFANIDYDTGVVDAQATGVVNNPIDGSAVSISLTPATSPSGSGDDVGFLAITFYQEVNGNQYALNDHGYDTLAVVGVA